MGESDEVMRARELKAARARLGLSQTALGTALGVTRDAIAKWEAGNRPVPTLVALALETLTARQEAAGRPGRAASRG